jgi:hypothetical protein
LIKHEAIQQILPEIINELKTNKRQNTPIEEQQKFILISQLYDPDDVKKVVNNNN